jgi:hypothetical protein
MNNELEVVVKKAVVTQSRYYPGTSWEWLRKTTKILSQGSRCPDLYSNRTSPEYKCGALPLD